MNHRPVHPRGGLRVARTVASLLCLVGGLMLAAGRPATPAGARPSDRLEARLEKLDPARPLEYLELAEELTEALRRGDSVDRELARRLYGLAGRLDPAGLGSSAALGLAWLSPQDERLAARYRAAASLLDGGGGNARGTGRPEVDAATAIEIGRAFCDFRTGRTTRLRRVLADPARERLLERWERALPGGGLEWLMSQSGTRHRPALTRGDLLSMIRVELALLDRGRPSWSTELAVDGDPPIIDLRADRILDLLLDEDALSRPLRREGAWVAP